MATYNTGSVAEYAYYLLNDVPTSISGAVMQSFADLSRLQVQNWTGQTISSTAIGESQFGILVKMTASMTLLRMSGQGADYSYTIGEFSTSKGNDNPNVQQSNFYWDAAMREMATLGKKMSVWKTLG